MRVSLLLLVFFCCNQVSAQTVLNLESGRTHYKLEPYLGVYEDKTGKVDINQISGSGISAKFIYFNNSSVNLRFSKSVIWVRIIIAKPPGGTQDEGMHPVFRRRWILSNNDPLTEETILYFRNPDPEDGSFIEARAGRSADFSKKEIHLNDFTGSFTLSQKMRDTIFIRVKSPSQLILSFNLLTEGEYAVQTAKSNMFHGILFGIFIILIIWNTILYYAVKKNIFIYYIMYIMFFGLFLFFYHGHLTEIFGFTSVNVFYLTMLTLLTFAAVFWVLLTREFLLTNKHYPSTDRLLVFLTLLAPLNLVLMFIFQKSYFAAILAVQFLIYYLIGLVLALFAARRGIYLAKYYLLALAGITVTIIISVSTRNNFLPFPWNFWTINAISFGVLWEAIILAGSVGYLFNGFMTEKEREKAKIRSQIASDLHDEVGSNLSTISLQSRIMMQESGLSQKIIGQLHNISLTASATVETIRDIVWFINPYHDRSADLYSRMKELASGMLFQFNYDFSSSQGENIFENLPDLNKRRHIYMIFKESLTNITKHSGATTVAIHLSEQENSFRMNITDDGRGFEDAKITMGEGLKNIRNRAALAGGTITIGKRNGGGTEILLEIPL
ncbi:MAG: hypothetical protein FMNOHCHN_00082 [Ignavibacteriaceae bacterium]|nr:hypothetical protein [Ignavibacteriaceae bacterium]